MCLALEAATGAWPTIVWHRDTEIPKTDLIVVPGGFTYGDYLRSGAMAAHSPILGQVKLRADAGVPVLGVCNGFQILTETGLLPGALMRNAKLKFICRDVHLKVVNNSSIFTRAYKLGDVARVPVAHGDGNYFADKGTLKRLADDDRIAFYYCNEAGAVTDEANPNGSQDNIAGILNEKGNVLGMMPHPENATAELFGGMDGSPLFRALSAMAA